MPTAAVPMNRPDVYPHPVRTEWKILVQLRSDTPTITINECAAQLGRSAGAIRYWLRTPMYQAYESWFIAKEWADLPLSVRKTRVEMKGELDEFAEEMLGRLRDIVETTNDNKLVAQIGFDMLDRAGYGEPKRDSMRPINFIITEAVAQQLINRAAEMEVTEGAVVGEALER